jgi:c(7)-type cytochrome triheme protein
MGDRHVRALGVLAITAFIGCGRVASVFFDVPEPSSASEAGSPAPSATSGAPARQDTVRPPIESTLDPERALALLPRDATNGIDWVAALREGVVKPRSSAPGVETPVMTGFRFDFLIQGPNAMFDALFPHSSHVEWLACETCHPAIFPYRGAPITMDAVNKGEACGQCHGTVAFSPATCYRCHTAMPPSGEQTPRLVRDIVFERTAADSGLQQLAGAEAYPPARFAHWVHRIRYRCSACHPTLFKAEAGSNAIAMEEIKRGLSCGTCHNGVTSFGSLDCQRCHIPAPAPPDSVP